MSEYQEKMQMINEIEQLLKKWNVAKVGNLLNWLRENERSEYLPF